jgi:TolA-binding protein
MHFDQLFINGTGLAHPDAGRAATHFQSVAEADATGRADEALLELAKSQVEAGRVEEAQKALATLLERFPNSERKAEAIRVRGGLAKGWRTL